MVENDDALAFEIERLMRALETLANPDCCRGFGTSTFQVMDRDGRPSGEEVTLCDGCGRQLSSAEDRRLKA